MKIYTSKAYARAALVGNPSDGYNGRTISVIVKNFAAEVVLYEWPTLEILPSDRDLVCHNSISELVSSINLNGYYGGMRLIKAAIKQFADYCRNNNIKLPDKNFSLRYSTNIPQQVGLAGFSAIITASMRALCSFYEVDIPKQVLPNIILAAEKDELGISAGLQDRVAQVYEGLTYMDFDASLLAKQGFGHYESLNPKLLTNLFIAYQTQLAESSDVFHNNIRHRYESGDTAVVSAMSNAANYAKEARQCLLDADLVTFATLMNKNFESRRHIYNLNPAHVRMVELAKEIGASANFTGSGGAIIGMYRDETMYQKLQSAFKEHDCLVIKPIME